jgi:hypothetical protein
MKYDTEWKQSLCEYEKDYIADFAAKCLNEQKNEIDKMRTSISELQAMIAFLILFIPDLDRRKEYGEWLIKRSKEE